MSIFISGGGGGRFGDTQCKGKEPIGTCSVVKLVAGELTLEEAEQVGKVSIDDVCSKFTPPRPRQAFPPILLRAVA